MGATAFTLFFFTNGWLLSWLPYQNRSFFGQNITHITHFQNVGAAHKQFFFFIVILDLDRLLMWLWVLELNSWTRCTCSIPTLLLSAAGKTNPTPTLCLFWFAPQDTSPPGRRIFEYTHTRTSRMFVCVCVCVLRFVCLFYIRETWRGRSSYGFQCWSNKSVDVYMCVPPQHLSLLIGQPHSFVT